MLLPIEVTLFRPKNSPECDENTVKFRYPMTLATLPAQEIWGEGDEEEDFVNAFCKTLSESDPDSVEDILKIAALTGPLDGGHVDPLPEWSKTIRQAKACLDLIRSDSDEFKEFVTLERTPEGDWYYHASHPGLKGKSPDDPADLSDLWDFGIFNDQDPGKDILGRRREFARRFAGRVICEHLGNVTVRPWDMTGAGGLTVGVTAGGGDAAIWATLLSILLSQKPVGRCAYCTDWFDMGRPIRKGLNWRLCKKCRSAFFMAKKRLREKVERALAKGEVFHFKDLRAHGRETNYELVRSEVIRELESDGLGRFDQGTGTIHPVADSPQKGGNT